ncbi:MULTISPECIES: hypothetical protein [Flavobacteriaceae]|uniref:Secreted protein n=1 Tax=Flagellimonas alvinocaridis TaxID=2530200 RepID=A0A4S8RWF9_9FLAO|nr:MULTISPECIES: hypothetical protein [Allomuricauda]MDC6364171.1 hypothetical protein [Muricauda sp. SP22]THV61615.1 hypothetical protein EZV76_04595 [Allomuricauda alvinocaridis]
MKRLVFSFLGLVLGISVLQAQSDLPTTRPLKIGERNDLDIKSSNQGTLLRMPSVLDENLKDKNDKPSVKMLPDRELLQAGHDMVIDPKVGEKEKKGSKEHFGDQYLGDFKTSSKFVGIVCRDHEYVDGDRIKIYVNGEVVEFNLLLTGSFKGINVDLVKGFNRIEFEALNQGSSGPNTAQVVVADEKGEVIHNNRWNLSTGSRASLIIVKEDE